MKISRILIVGVGSCLGGLLRYTVSTWTAGSFGDFPFGTLLVNIAGGFLIGFIMEAGGSAWPISADLRLFLTTGIMGGLTTFSTFSYETVSFFSEGKYLMGSMNAGLNLFLALLFCWFGKAAAQLI